VGRLDEVLEILSEQSDELSEEGVNTLDYWLARCNIDKDEYFEWMVDYIRGIMNQDWWENASNRNRIMSVATHAFLAGLILGREKRESEF